MACTGAGCKAGAFATAQVISTHDCAKNGHFGLDPRRNFWPQAPMVSHGKIVNPPPRAALRILATSDVHMHLSGLDEVSQKPSTGLARLAKTIRAQQENAPGAVLLVDNGDSLQGTALARAAFEGAWDHRHPLVRVMTALKLDAMGLGNHDFDFGVSYLEAMCAAFPCAVVSANTDGLANIQDRVVLSREVTCDDGKTRTLRIGLTSALPHQTGGWLSHKLKDRVRFGPPLERLSAAVSALREEGADVVIVLAHAGFEADAYDTENFASRATTLEGVDALVAGHTHWLFPNPADATSQDAPSDFGHVNGLPCVMPGFGASCLGQVDLVLAFDDATGWRVDHSGAQLLFPADDEAPDEDVLALIAPTRAALTAKNADVVGETTVHLHSYFALLRPNPLFGFLGQAMVDALEDALDLPDALAGLPRLAAVAPALSGGRAGPDQYVDVAPGPVHRQALETLCPFEDVLAARIVTGRDLRNHLERAAAIFAPRNSSRASQRLLDWDMPGFCFDMIYGLSVEIDPDQPPRYNAVGAMIDANAHRVTGLAYQGTPVTDDMRFVLALTSYRAGGGGGFPDGGTLAPFAQPAPVLRDIIEGALARGFTATEPDWRLRPQNGRVVTFDTSPRAADHLDEIAAFAPQSLGLTADGFLRLKLHL